MPVMGRPSGWSGPERGVEQFLDLMLRLVQIHRHLLFDDLALLADVRRVEPGVEQHIQQHIEQFVEAVMARRGHGNRSSPRS